MAQTIDFEYEGTKYTLEFSRATIKQMESSGFTIADLNRKPVTSWPMFFAGAFLLHHRKLKEDKIREIYKHMTDKDRLMERLTEMYYEALSTLMDDPDEDDAKKIVW